VTAASRQIRYADIDREPQRQGLQSGDKFVTMTFMRDTRSVSWIRAARKDFEAFPAAAQDDILDALAVAAEGRMSGKAKPFKGVEGGVFEIAARHRGDAFRAIYAVKIDVDVWVIHAFQKKSKSGIKTPLAEVDLIRERLKRLTEALR
jgi:phage-related protein